MFDWLLQIADFLKMVVNIVLMLLSSIVQFFAMLPSWITFLHTGVLLVPSILAPFILLGISLSVVLLIVGRNS